MQNAVEYATKHVYLWQSSPVSGAFDIRKYPFIRGPLESLDDILVKESVIYGPAQSFKSVFLQIATAYRLAVSQCSVLAVAQSDDDADEFSKVKLGPFLDRIPHLDRMQVAKPTINLRRWANHELIISGPGANAQNSKSARFVHTDEAHLYKHGALAALMDRCGQRWNRHGLHVTTAADAGTEVDTKYYQANQCEWNVRCIHCNSLFMPLWEDESRRVYNGHRVFQWMDNGSETETLNSIHYVCPHCDKEIENTPRYRVLMDDGADYVAMNPAADGSMLSFRWNAFASRFKPLRDLLSIYLKAIESAKLGDFKPYENWVKKQEVRTWTGEIPSVGIADIGRDHRLSDIEVVEQDLPLISCDVQDAGGFHIWALVDLWHANGDSKRLAYEKLASFDDLRALQLRYNVKDLKDTKTHSCVCIDHGHRQPEVFAACAKYDWLALKSTDEDGFSHVIRKKNEPDTYVDKPWSVVRMGNPLLGKENAHRAKLCHSRLWSKPRLYSLFYRLKQGETTRKYSIAEDFSPVFVEQVHSYIPAASTDKKTGSTGKEYWRKVKKGDHAFICGAQSLLLAIIHRQYSVPDL